MLLIIASVATLQLHAVRVVPVRRTPESRTVQLFIAFPREYENRTRQPISMQMRLEGFPLGITSDFDRKTQVYNDPRGQSLHVFIDDRPYVSYHESVEDSFDENRVFYDRFLNFDLPYRLDSGQHVIRALPCRSFGECLKERGAYAMSIFYVNDANRESSIDFDPDAPCLTYNLPQGTYPAAQADPILLDFYLSNVQLSRDGYKVRLSVDGRVEGLLAIWTPYYLYGLGEGRHTIRLELIDSKEKVVSGPFNDVQREIVIR
jgi:hypothetical protein